VRVAGAVVGGKTNGTEFRRGVLSKRREESPEHLRAKGAGAQNPRVVSFESHKDSLCPWQIPKLGKLGFVIGIRLVSEEFWC
jgi:hypothetical protein